MSWTGTRRVAVADAALAVALAVAATVPTAVLGWTPEPDATLDGPAVGLLIAAGLVLAFRRRWPLATLAATTGAITAYLLLGYPVGLVFLPFAVAVYTVARHRPLRWAVPAAVAGFGLLLTHVVVGALAGERIETFGSFAFAAGWTAVPFAIGVTVRTTREMADRARAELVRTHVDEERLRVAQEVHDIVGHGLAAIKMQADVALHVQGKRPGQAHAALSAISRTSSEALAELRATLAVVRAGGDSERSPTPGLERLAELRRRMGEAGLAVRMETDGQPRELPPVVDLTGYRIVQESLTNVLRHSAASLATVRIRYAAGTLEVTVTNPAGGGGNGSGPDDGGGSGIEGMRRRVESLGGSFSAGSTLDGWFEVRAALPTGGAT